MWIIHHGTVMMYMFSITRVLVLNNDFVYQKLQMSHCVLYMMTTRHEGHMWHKVKVAKAASARLCMCTASFRQAASTHCPSTCTPA